MEAGVRHDCPDALADALRLRSWLGLAAFGVLGSRSFVSFNVGIIVVLWNGPKLIFLFMERSRLLFLHHIDLIHLQILARITFKLTIIIFL